MFGDQLPWREWPEILPKISRSYLLPTTENHWTGIRFRTFRAFEKTHVPELNHGPMPPLRTDHFFYLLAMSEIALALFKRSRKGSLNKDRGSLVALWCVIGAAIFAAIRCTLAFPDLDIHHGRGLFRIALLLFLGGTTLRWWSIIHLGRFFTVNVAITKDHRVVDDGPYRLVRHPSYSGLFLVFTGLGLMLFNWVALFVLTLPIFAMFVWRMNVEEHALMEALGEPYDDYMKHTKRFVPFVY